MIKCCFQKQLGLSIWRNLVAYHMMILSREDLGIERSLGGIFFVKGYFDESKHFMWYMKVEYMFPYVVHTIHLFKIVLILYVNALIFKKTLSKKDL